MTSPLLVFAAHPACDAPSGRAAPAPRRPAWLTVMCARPVLGFIVGSGLQGELAPRLVAVAAVLLLVLGSRHDSRLRRLGFVRWLAWIGGFLYSLYLIHVPVASPFMNLGGRFSPPSSQGFTALWLAGLGLALAAGWALHHFVEAPAELWRKKRIRPAVA